MNNTNYAFHREEHYYNMISFRHVKKPLFLKITLRANIMIAMTSRRVLMHTSSTINVLKNVQNYLIMFSKKVLESQ